ncbi:MAG: response regulator [Clostridia bacterium]|nr:response regulator [Clostridia bacterium]MBR6208204.1 response regulator [Oscillospiraceae bacterium]MBR6860331.1 response regulator [Acidaminococcaceae bacterium]
MRIYVIDDEPTVLKASEQVIRRALPDAEVTSFHSAAEALDTLNNPSALPDVCFCDIEMPGINGLEFALRLKKISPETKIIFVTAYSEYALEAFRIHANGYILKPINVVRVQEEIGESAASPREADTELLKVQCFGSFEVFWQGKPLLFSRKKTRELFAYLVDRKGALCSSEEIATAVWEDDGDIRNTKTHIRVLISDLRKTLANIGQEDVVIRQRGQVAINTDKLDCDYYRMLKGDVNALNSFKGEYMTQYSWAEITAGQLTFEKWK